MANNKASAILARSNASIERSSPNIKNDCSVVTSKTLNQDAMASVNKGGATTPTGSVTTEVSKPSQHVYTDAELAKINDPAARSNLKGGK